MTKRMRYRDWRWLALWWHHFFLLWSTIDGQTRYSIPEELKQGSVVGNLAKDLGLALSDIFDRRLRVASQAGEQYFSVDAGKATHHHHHLLCLNTLSQRIQILFLPNICLRCQV
uniref:Cadherin N-terminal domain-containing protein n=1 Tax=Neolamprologus brichardi TaxID=32507 RepID=A0A3Q4GFX7_NEOBR